MEEVDGLVKRVVNEHDYFTDLLITNMMFKEKGVISVVDVNLNIEIAEFNSLEIAELFTEKLITHGNVFNKEYEVDVNGACYSVDLTKTQNKGDVKHGNE